MSETHQNEDRSKQYIRNTVLSFGVIAAILVAGYLAYTRYDFATLYSGLDIQDASMVAAELDRQEIRYRVGENGTAILVPEQNIDAVRLAVYSSNGPTQGLTGFELFNESEMGLTDFAQKIKFQRAIQGELSRTIMMMEGVKKARVHVAIPERSVFRSQRTDATAAVTLISKDGIKFGDDSILGIQRLVASSIPGLTLRRVTVVDGRGRIISKSSHVFELDPDRSYRSDELVSVKANADNAGMFQLASMESTTSVVRPIPKVSTSFDARLENEENSDPSSSKVVDDKTLEEQVVSAQASNPSDGVSAMMLDIPTTDPVVNILKVKPDVSAKMNSWIFLLLGGLVVIGLLGFTLYRRFYAGLTETQRVAFAEELGEALRRDDLKVSNG